MLNLLLIFAATMLLSYLSQQRILTIRGNSSPVSYFLVMVIIIIMSFHCGLRTAYNDTLVYVQMYDAAPTVEEYLASGVKLTENPLYGLFQSWFRQYVSDNYHHFFFVIALFTMSSFVRFITRFAHDFTMSMFLFFILLYLLPFAAMKQGFAMAILVIAIEKLLDKRYVTYFILVVVAALFHTYAFLFVVLPIFQAKPWTWIIYIAVAIVSFIVITFETSITQLLEMSDGFGRDISAEVLLSETGMNLFRVAVYGVTPLIAFVFQKRIRMLADRKMSLMINISTISFLFACMGAVNAANMFGRAANYFIMGAIISLPWLIDQIFTKRSAKLIKSIAIVAYLAFFYVDTQYFVTGYRAISVGEYILSFFG